MLHFPDYIKSKLIYKNW